jgi:hypothetical protein
MYYNDENNEQKPQSGIVQKQTSYRPRCLQKKNDFDWKRVFEAWANPKLENGEEYIDVTEEEKEILTLFVDFLAAQQEATKDFKEGPKLPLWERNSRDERFNIHIESKFAHLTKEPTP